MPSVVPRRQISVVTPLLPGFRPSPIRHYPSVFAFPWPILQKTDPKRWVRFWLSQMKFPHRLDQTWVRLQNRVLEKRPRRAWVAITFLRKPAQWPQFVNHGTTRVSAVGGLPAGWWRKRPCLWCRPVVAALAKRGPAHLLAPGSWLLAPGYCATSLISKPSRWERRDATPKVYPDSEVGATRRASRAGASECKTIRYIKELPRSYHILHPASSTNYPPAIHQFIRQLPSAPGGKGRGRGPVAPLRFN